MSNKQQANAVHMCWQKHKFLSTLYILIYSKFSRNPEAFDSFFSNINRQVYSILQAWWVLPSIIQPCREILDTTEEMFPLYNMHTVMLTMFKLIATQ